MLVALIAACGGPKGEIELAPKRLDFGEVDFQDEMPEGGYLRTEVVLTSAGEADVTATLAKIDLVHLCLEGFNEGMIPAELPVLAPDQDYSLFFSVCAYVEEDGERDTLVSGDVVIETDGDPERILLPWSFTPVRNILDDTGE